MEAAFKADLTAVLVAVQPAQGPVQGGRGVSPVVLTLADTGALPSGPLAPQHRSLQAGLRAWVEHTTRHPLGHVEQLYTFADRDRSREGADADVRAISISYLALTRAAPDEAGWVDWYAHFPWEDQRGEAGKRVAARLADALDAWCRTDAGADREARARRVSIAFGQGNWQDELVLQRYELLHEAGLVAESGSQPPGPGGVPGGRPMPRDHRRILATGIARLRAKIKYRPVFFELLPDRFTFLELQDTVEALSGVRLHKPNFRRLIAQQALIEDTGQISADRPGRPAKLFRFRREVLEARAIAGTKLPLLPTR